MATRYKERARVPERRLIGPTMRVSTTLTEADAKLLDGWADHHNRSRSSLVRVLLLNDLHGRHRIGN
jgi:hypothetical protein